jgi:hypothetical protein
MHVLHLILIEADEAEDITDESLPFYEGESHWWDWFEIGGRWNGCLDGKNVLPLSDVANAREALEGVIIRQEAEFTDMQRKLSGAPITKADAPDYVFGLALPDKDGYVGRTNEANAATARAFRDVLSAPSLAAAHAVMAETPHSLIGYYIERFGKFIDGDWTPDSGFWDSVDYTANPKSALAKLGTEDAEGLFLVACDFHY